MHTGMAMLQAPALQAIHHWSNCKPAAVMLCTVRQSCPTCVHLPLLKTVDHGPAGQLQHGAISPPQSPSLMVCCEPSAITGLGNAALLRTTCARRAPSL